jgi:hypothetical protein
MVARDIENHSKPYKVPQLEFVGERDLESAML